MRNKELIERIENLEKALQKEVSLREQTDKTANELKEVFDFVVEHGKDGFCIEINYGFLFATKSIKYLYQGKLKEVELGSDLDINIIKTTEKEIIFTRLDDIYFKIDKATATYMQIPEPLFVSKDKEKQTKEKKKGENK